VAVMGSPSGTPTSVVLGGAFGCHETDTRSVILRTGVKTPAPARRDESSGNRSPFPGDLLAGVTARWFHPPPLEAARRHLSEWPAPSCQASQKGRYGRLT
jgi:hypothetical protein